MSAIRRNERRANRTNISSPYARPSKSANAHPSKKSPWSLSGLINFLNPFGGKGEQEDSGTSGPSDSEIERRSPPRRFSPPQQPLPPPPLPPPPQQTSSSPWPSVANGPKGSSSHISQSSPAQPFSLNTPVPTGSSLAKNLEPVTRFLVEKAGQPLNEFEAAGIVDYIQKNVQGSTSSPDKPEPFRFSVSPSRSASPNVQGASNTQTARKTLSRNPNGVYRWQGAGSSRPRNRYQSAGFTPRPQQHRIKLSPPKIPLTTDTKRRRVGDEAEFSTPQKPLPSTSTIRFPSPAPESPAPSSHLTTELSTTSLNGKITISSLLPPTSPVTPKQNGIQPRIRTAGLVMKPTTPAIPSPLRQAWKESDSPPQASPPSRATRAADFMTELIKGVTPTKKPDISNPYQTASPVKPPAPVRKPMVKRPRPSTKPTEKPTELEPEMSAQAIIEATVPKGTKRSRPPLEMERPTYKEEALGSETSVFALNGSVYTTFNVAETITRGEESPSKRLKSHPIKPLPVVQEIDETSVPKVIVRPAEIIEPADGPALPNGKRAISPPAVTSPPSVTKALLGGVKTSAPKEPSKLRYSIHADKVEVKPSAELVELVLASPPAPTFTPSPIVPPAIPKTTASVVPAKAKLSPKEEAFAMDIDELPKYTFSAGTTSSFTTGPSFSSFSVTRSAVLSLAISSLPAYEFTPTIAPVRAMNGFNWTAAGMRAPIVAQGWQCSLCGLQNPADAMEKCTVCEAPREVPTNPSSSVPTPAPGSSTPTVTVPPAIPSKSFDWSAAGLIPPSKSEKEWTCTICGLSNPATAVDKCSICETPR